ncbi:MAG: pantoate--beta-alanine ligase [Desulfobacteraceae bacterium 4572_35.1]|nr:MAG: pantoate--beta-alanine ligase [Desulfobacteraceae bacterium 4572_35.1]
METITSVSQMQEFVLAARQQGKIIGFVPTMGYLHQGHFSLMEEGRKCCDLLVLSIFVNPTQFGQGEDFDSYPRDLSRDSKLAASAGVDVIFAPTPEQMYPDGCDTNVHVAKLTENLCGASRPGHFDGVTTVVSKLFNIVQPHKAFFGMKDFQQLAVIKKMVNDLNMTVDVIGMPIVREKDGLAMSSRNTYLTANLRQQGLSLVDSIRKVIARAQAGEKCASVLITMAKQRIAQEPDAVVDYIQICHDQTLKDVACVDEHSVILLAVRFGLTRLIDNHYVLREL